MAKSDGLKHGRPLETVEVVCDCECSRYQHCPLDSDSPCKKLYIEHLKALKAQMDKEQM
jgi:hypothetical protein